MKERREKNKKTKVLHVIHGLNTGGAETLVKDYALLMDKSEIEIVILCKNRLNTPYETILAKAGIQVIYMDDKLPSLEHRSILASGVRYIGYHLLARKYIREIKPDVIHTHLTVNSYVKFARPQKETKIFHTAHNELKKLWNRKNHKLWKDFKTIKWLFLHYDTRIIALHEDMRQQINSLFKVDNTIVLNNGIHLSRFQNTLDKENVRKDIGIPQDAYVIGHVGRFSYAKNHTFLVDIFAELYKKNPNCFLLMIGDGDERKNIESKLCELGFKDKYLILSNRTDIPDLLKAMDMFVFPSRFEGLGISLIEAQVSKLPSVISNKVPKAAIISNQVLVKDLEESPKAWAEAILDMYEKKTEPEYYHLEDWDMEHIVKQLGKIYKAEE